MTACDDRKRDLGVMLDLLNMDKPGKLCCRFHDDKNPSAEVKVGDDGVVRYTCYSGNCGFHGDVFDVEAKITGRTPDELMRQYRQANPASTSPSKPKPAPKVFQTIKALTDSVQYVAAVHAGGYADPTTGEIPLMVLRIEPPGERKRFIQCRPERGGWVMKAPAGMLPLYNRAGVVEVDRVVLVEGEKCVGYLHQLGIAAATWPGGCKAPLDRIDWRPLNGKLDVILWPDADNGGIDAMRKAQRLIEALSNPPRVHIIDPGAFDLTDGDDVVNYAERFDDDDAKRAAIQGALDVAEPMGASRDVLDFYRGVREGKIKCVPSPWSVLNRATQALIPGSITLLAGGAGVSKSFMLVQLFRHLHATNIPAIVRMLEKKREYHLQRALAQHVNNAGLCDFDWLKENAEEAEVIAGENADFLDNFGRCVQGTGDGITSLSDLAAWVEQQAQRGMRVIAIDPITLADADDRRWEQDRRFMKQVGDAVGKTGASLILTTHPPKNPQGTINLDHLAGGAAYTRAADTVFFLEYHAEPKDVTVRPVGQFAGAFPMPFCETINRTVHILKARNGRGNGWRIGFNFEADSLTFKECGVIVKGGGSAAAGSVA